MKIGIIGGGIAGLTAAYRLSKSGHNVVVFEKDACLGGQAGTFDICGQPLEKYYHHIFTSDSDIICLIDELGLGAKLKWLASNVGLYYQGKTYKWVGAFDLLRFPGLSLVNRFRLGLTTLQLQRHKNWHDLENLTAQEWIIQHVGRKNYEVIWEPLLRGKFGERADEIGMVWFWGKIYLRFSSRGKSMQKERLGYLMGSYGQVINTLAQKIQESGGKINTGTTVKKIIVEDNQVKGILTDRGEELFNVVIATIPSSSFLSLVAELPKNYREKLQMTTYQATACLVLTLKKSLSPFYWMNISDTSMPFVAVIEHTNLVKSSNYNNKHIIYVSNYLTQDSLLYRMDAAELLEYYLPYLQKINPEFNREWVEDCFLWKDEAAQPIISTNYSQHITEHRTSIDGLYLANTTQIYPEDRGMNYSVRLGNKISELVLDNTGIE